MLRTQLAGHISISSQLSAIWRSVLVRMADRRQRDLQDNPEKSATLLSGHRPRNVQKLDLFETTGA
jgi:hypothetical protein